MKGIRIMVHKADGAKKKLKTGISAAEKPGSDHHQAPPAAAAAATAAAAACAGVPLLNLAAGEEVTGLSKDEMASVCDKLEQFARKNPHRVEADTGDGGGGGGGSRRER